MSRSSNPEPQPSRRLEKGNGSVASGIQGEGLQNAPTTVEKLGAFTVEGYSRAAVQTYWRIHEMKIGFDLGAQPWDFMAIPNYFISHCHLDHIAALPAYVARRRMMKMEAPVVYLPDEFVPTVDAMLRTFTQLDRGRLPCKLVGLVPGDSVELSRELVVEAIRVKHTVPALGFVVWERRKKLKPEYLGLSGNEIRDIKLAGQEVTNEVRIPLLGYTGDTSPEGLDQNPVLFESEILITEMTFLSASHRKEKIHKRGHLHLDDIVARRSAFKNKYIVCGHFSVRYNDSQIRRMVKRAIPDMLDGRLRLWL